MIKLQYPYVPPYRVPNYVCTNKQSLPDYHIAPTLRTCRKLCRTAQQKSIAEPPQRLT